MSFRLAVFDMAGTTVADENAVAGAFRKAFAAFDLDVPEEGLNLLMGYKKTLAIQIVLEKLGVKWNDELIEKIHEHFVGEMLDHYEYSSGVKALPGAEELFLQLKEHNIRIALNTGFPRLIADAILRRLQWQEKGLVDDYIASDEVDKGRPAPLMIQALMKRSDIEDPMEVIKVGDTEVDINEGRNAGCGLVIAMTTGAFSKEELEPYHPDFILDKLSDLSPLIFDRG